MEKREPLYILLMGMSVGAATKENSKMFLKKLKIEILYNSTVPHPNTYLKKIKTLIWKEILTITKIWKPPKCSLVNEYMDKEDVVYIQWILLSHKNEWHLANSNNMGGLEGIN